jgi:hypothetical protein
MRRAADRGEYRQAARAGAARDGSFHLWLTAASPPWSVEEQSACFVVRDHNGQALAVVYFGDEPGRKRHPTLTLAEAMDALCWHGGL